MKKEQVCVVLDRYRKNKKTYDTDRITFTGVSDSVYNISRPFLNNGKTYILGRVEALDSEISKVLVFEQVSKKEYKLVEGIELDLLQDPCVCEIDGELFIGGTHIDVVDGQIVSWNTAFYRGQDVASLQHFANAPAKMKDVRFTKYGQKILVCTRPQGGVAGPGKIGLILLDDFVEITPDNLLKAKLFDDLFADNEWGGANELFVLDNGWVGVLGHIACMSEGDVRHYYAMTFAFHPKTMEHTPVKIIAERADFKAGISKRPDLVDVLFSGGIVRQDDNMATLYTGTSDAEGHYIVIEDPFKEYEELPAL